jgi:hypothetical protein
VLLSATRVVGALSLVVLGACGRLGYEAHERDGGRDGGRRDAGDADGGGADGGDADGGGVDAGRADGGRDAGAAGCRTAEAPNFVGRCAMAVDVLVPNGCRFEYDYNSCCTPTMYLEYEWDVYECQDGAWVGVDSGADVSRCTGCVTRTWDYWTDTCGDASAATMTCSGG